MGTWRPIITKTPTLLRISWFWVFFKRIFDVNGCVGNKKSTIVDQNYYHQKGLTVSYKKHFYHFLIRRILFSISSFLCWEYARTPLENLTFKWFVNIRRFILDFPFYSFHLAYKSSHKRGYNSLHFSINFLNVDKHNLPFFVPMLEIFKFAKKRKLPNKNCQSVVFCVKYHFFLFHH